MACALPPLEHDLWGQPRGGDGGEDATILITPHCSPVLLAQIAQVLQGPRGAGPKPSPLSLLPQGPGQVITDAPQMALEEVALYAESGSAAAPAVPLKGAALAPPGSSATTGTEAVAVAASEAVAESVAVRGRVSSPKMSVETKRQRMCPHSPQECTPRGGHNGACYSQSGLEHGFEVGTGHMEPHVEHDLGSPFIPRSDAACMEPFSLHPDTPEQPEASSFAPVSPPPDTVSPPENAMQELCIALAAPKQVQTSQGLQGSHAPGSGTGAGTCPGTGAAAGACTGTGTCAGSELGAGLGPGTDTRLAHVTRGAPGSASAAGNTNGAGYASFPASQASSSGSAVEEHRQEEKLQGTVPAVYQGAGQRVYQGGYQGDATLPAREASGDQRALCCTEGVLLSETGAARAGPWQGELERESSSGSSQHQSQHQSKYPDPNKRQHQSQHQGHHQSQHQGQNKSQYQGQYLGRQRVPGARGGKEGDIFRAVLDGDLEGLQRCLRDSPSSINAKKSATWQTPLHCAAAAGRDEVVELLTHWTGQDRANLEARNTYGETPLHVAAKNCSPGAVRILLKAGACVAALTTNGMTALHLAVWSTGSSEDTDTAELLLTSGAQLECKDKDGRTPMDLVPRGDSTMATLLDHHLRLQRASKAQASVANPESGREILEELEEELRRIVGVPELKAQLRRWAKGMLLDRRRRSLGLDIRPQQAPHMAFLGNPGTGKTSVARVLSRLLHRVGVVAEEKLVEVQRTDLVGEFVGHTGPKTRAVIERAKGGVLFVDEAYRLVPAFKAGEKDYGLEALEEIMAAMDSGALVVILAGYKEPMRRVFDANEGLCRRVARCFEFEDLSCSDIARVMMLKMEGPRARSHGQEQLESTTGIVTGVPPTEFPLQGFRLHRECTEEALAALLEQATSKEQRQNHNGALALTALVAARGHLDSRLDVECSDLEELVSLRLCDIAAGLEQVSP